MKHTVYSQEELDDAVRSNATEIIVASSGQYVVKNDARIGLCVKADDGVVIFDVMDESFADIQCMGDLTNVVVYVASNASATISAGSAADVSVIVEHGGAVKTMTEEYGCMTVSHLAYAEALHAQVPRLVRGYAIGAYSV